MSASAILSPTPVSVAPSGTGSTADAPGPSGEFGAILATEIVETTAAPPVPVVGIPVTSETASTPEPIGPDVIVEEAQVPATEGSGLPLWLQLLPQLPPALVAVERKGASTDDAPLARQATDPDAGIVQAPTGVADAIDGIDPARLTDQPARTPDTASAPPAAQVKAGTVVPARVDRLPVQNSPLAEAALASLRAVPGAAALQQATVSQRKIDTATVSNVADDGASASSGAKTASTLTIPPTTTPDLAAKADDPKTAPVDLIVGNLSDIAEAPLPPSEGDTATAVLPGATSSAGPATSTATTDTSLSSLSRATIETTAHLAAQITSRLAGRSTRFELGLTPEGLGRVDVTLDIDADGQLAARLAFDNPLAATELRGRADELRRQLEDAGFTIARDALDFSSRDNPSGGGPDRRQQRATAYADRHAAQVDLADTAPPWTLSPSSRLTPQGVDVKV